MCGLVGFLQPAGLAAPAAEELVRSLAARLTHRGPDAQGVWVDGVAGIALGHRRLSVLDLSSAGDQPMVSASGKYVIAFNGEIYNHTRLREELDQLESSLSWRGHSDTETLLAAFDRWGVEQALRKVVGMFAFALWDRQQRVLTLARDRLGEKPLYYGWNGDVFLFGSELKALRAHPAFLADVERSALALYMRYGYIPAPASIYRNVHKLTPGTYVQISTTTPRGTLPEPVSYWSLRQAVERGLADPFSGSDADAVGELEAHLISAISGQRTADVPLGAFLSGGVDSSTIVALMQADSFRAVRTYTIGYEDSDCNEAGYAQAVAKHLGTEHNELRVTAQTALDAIPRVTALFDEPFGDSSAIPTFLVSSFARHQVTVALSGDGGDELFGGYGRYQRTVDIWNVMRHIPYRARSAAAIAVRSWRRNRCATAADDKTSRIASYLSATTLDECYETQISRFMQPHELVINGTGDPGTHVTPYSAQFRDGGVNAMMYTDSLRYLPDDILTKVDRASMSVSLEVRVPMLDHRVLEFAWRLPTSMKVRDRRGKWLLRQLLGKYLPTAMIDRPKMGFGVPVGRWLRGPLREWGEYLLAEDRLRKDGFLNPQAVRRCWQRHLSTDRGESDALWQILAFQAWVADAV